MYHYKARQRTPPTTFFRLLDLLFDQLCRAAATLHAIVGTPELTTTLVVMTTACCSSDEFDDASSSVRASPHGLIGRLLRERRTYERPSLVAPERRFMADYDPTSRNVTAPDGHQRFSKAVNGTEVRRATKQQCSSRTTGTAPQHRPD